MQSTCALDDRSPCPITMPQKRTARAILSIKDMVLSPAYRHMSIRALALHAQRVGDVLAHPVTWYKLMRERGWAQPRSREYPQSPTVGIRATTPNEAWHVDTTIIELLDGTKAYLHAVIDNYWRKILSWTVAESMTPLSTYRPPEFFTEATLLSAMESAGAALEGELSLAMRDRGLGTPATRATTIEELVAKDYMRRQGKQLRATELGISLVRRVHKHVASPAMTGDLEAKLRRIERGQADPEQLLDEVCKFVSETTRQALANGVAPRKSRPQPLRVPRASSPRSAVKSRNTQGAKSSAR